MVRPGDGPVESVRAPRGEKRAERGRFDPDSHRLRGAYSVDGRLLFVTPGIGTSILPMRLGVPPEISRLTLRQAAPTDPSPAPR